MPIYACSELIFTAPEARARLTWRCMCLGSLPPTSRHPGAEAKRRFACSMTQNARPLDCHKPCRTVCPQRLRHHQVCRTWQCRTAPRRSVTRILSRSHSRLCTLCGASYPFTTYKPTSLILLIPKPQTPNLNHELRTMLRIPSPSPRPSYKGLSWGLGCRVQDLIRVLLRN